MINKISFKVNVPLPEEEQDNDNEKKTKEVSLDVRRPNLVDTELAQEAYNLGFHKAMKSKAPLRIEVEQLLTDRKIWNQNKQEEHDRLSLELAQKVNKLKGGGLKLQEGRKLAIQIRRLRTQIASLNLDRRVLDGSTAEAQAEAARFNYFVAACTVYSDTGKPFFADKNGNPDVTVYLEQANQDHAQECAKRFATLQYGLDPNFEKNLPENKFLLRFKFVNDELALINRDGHLIDEDGNLVDKEGFVVDENGNRRDRTGATLDKDGNVIIEEQPFLDDETAQPVLV